MEFRQLNYFIAVAEEANLTVASRRLNVSQPPLTRQIKQLEDELGAVLFRRSSRGVQLTAAGTSFLVEARRLVQIAKSASDKARAADRGEIGQLDVGYFGTIIHAAVPRAIRRFKDAWPHVTVQIRRASKSEQYAQLRDGRLGVGFARHYVLVPDIETICVSQERLYIASRVGHPLNPDGASFSLSHLEGQDLIVFPGGSRPTFGDQILDMITAAGVRPSNVNTAEDVFTALAVTMISDTVCVLPEFVAQLNWPELRIGLIEDPQALTPVNCIFLAKGRPPVVDAFLETISS